MSEEINKAEEMKEVSAEARWYVVHTYSGYENKVKANIEKTVENRGMQDQIFEVSVPLQDVVEMKDGQKKTVQRKVFPGYVLLNMIMNDETWSGLGNYMMTFFVIVPVMLILTLVYRVKFDDAMDGFI